MPLTGGIMGGGGIGGTPKNTPARPWILPGFSPALPGPAGRLKSVANSLYSKAK